jgi:carbonic anhydrase
VDGHRYDLKQFHFHVPSEHAMGGQRWDATAHLVHADKDGNLAVVGVQLEQGETNPFLETLRDHLPGERHAELALGFHMESFLPAEREFFTYSGSLTTPPCSEGVRWFVLYNPVELSSAQLDQLKKYHAFNARPLQPLNDREIDHVVASPAGL